MERQAVRLTREKLYEKMWSRPAISRCGIWNQRTRPGQDLQSLRDSCPSARYWAKLAAGKHATRIPLPTAKSNVPQKS